MSRNAKDGKSTDELKSMLMSFRIAELQTLLATCGRSRSGRKHELLGRAVSLLKSSEGSAMRERVKSRILELYHQRYANGTAPPPPSTNDSVPTSTQYSHSATTTQQSNYLNRPNNNSNNYQLPRNGPPYMSEARNNVHQVAMMPTNPDVKFISLPFYELIDELYKPVSLQPKTISGYQEQIIQYHMTPYQTQLITNSRSVHVKSMIEYAVQVQLRFCLNETSCVQEDLYPSRCKIIVNGKGLPLPGQPPPNTQNQEPRKPHRPVNITSYCRLSPMQSNTIQVQWIPSDLGKRHAATLHLVKIVQADALIQQLESKSIRSKAHSIGFIKEKLSPDPDSEVAMTSLKVSLCCPIGRTRMKMPCRGDKCKHLQCFDGSTYIQMNERKPSWMCPVCDQKAYYGDLFKDGLFMSIIAEARDCEDIVFFEDGSWKALEEIQQDQEALANNTKVPETPQTPKSVKPSNMEVCDTPPVLTISTPDTSSVSNTITVPVSAPQVPPMPPLECPSNSNKTTNGQSETPDEDEVEVIVLDDSDSDADEPLVSTSSANRAGGLPLPRFSDPQLQGLELYKLLPHADRVAAARYIDQNGILNGGNPKPPKQQESPNVIDISDE